MAVCMFYITLKLICCLLSKMELEKDYVSFLLMACVRYLLVVFLIFYELRGLEEFAGWVYLNSSSKHKKIKAIVTTTSDRANSIFVLGCGSR